MDIYLQFGEYLLIIRLVLVHSGLAIVNFYVSGEVG